MVRLKNIKKQLCPERTRINTHRDSNILFEHHISDSEVKYILSRPLEVQHIEIIVNSILLRIFDLKIKCIVSKRTLINKL